MGTVFLFLYFLCFGQLPLQEERKITQEEIAAVIQAAQDEIYEYDYQGHFDLVGEGIGDRAVRVAIYFEPRVSIKDRTGWVIYKLMPYGEVFREFYIRSDGLASFPANPELGFPPTQPSYLTVYIEDDKLCRFKREWRKTFFVVEFKPSPERVKEAIERQKKRYGVTIRNGNASKSKQKPTRGLR